MSCATQRHKYKEPLVLVDGKVLTTSIKDKFERAACAMKKKVEGN